VTYEDTIRDLNQRLKDAEKRADDAESQNKRLMKENEKLEYDLSTAHDAYSALNDELEGTLKDLGGM